MDFDLGPDHALLRDTIRDFMLAEVAPKRVAVIQSTGDAYLGAARARQLFGVDTALRRFFGVTAKNHRFSGGTDAFAAALKSALAWVLGQD